MTKGVNLIFMNFFVNAPCIQMKNGGGEVPIIELNILMLTFLRLMIILNGSGI